MTSLITALSNRATSLPLAPLVRYPTFLSAASRERIMEEVGTVFAIVSKTSEAVAAVNWRLYRKSTDQRRRFSHSTMGERREVTQHAALRVLNRPNPFMTRQNLMERYAQTMYLRGESVWHLPIQVRSLGPAEIWPVAPHRITVIPSPENYIAGYEFRAPDGQIISLDPEEIIFSKRPNPHDEFRGLGPIQAILGKADSIRFADEYNLALFRNDAQPGGILKVGADLKDREIDRLQKRWLEAFQGAHNAGRIGILDAEDAEWIPNANTQRDMQFAELQSLNSEKIREAFAFPKFMLGSTEDANRSSAEASKVIFAEFTLVPLLERIKQELNHRYLPMFGASAEALEFDYDSPVPESAEEADASLATRSRAALDLVSAGYYAPDVLEALGLPEMSFGQPGLDPDRQLLVDLVKAAPGALFDRIAPLLGIVMPADLPPVDDDNAVNPTVEGEEV